MNNNKCAGYPFCRERAHTHTHSIDSGKLLLPHRHHPQNMLASDANKKNHKRNVIAFYFKIQWRIYCKIKRIIVGNTVWEHFNDTIKYRLGFSDFKFLNFFFVIFYRSNYFKDFFGNVWFNLLINVSKYCY